jgi:hypothetical protein
VFHASGCHYQKNWFDKWITLKNETGFQITGLLLIVVLIRFLEKYFGLFSALFPALLGIMVGLN